MAPVHLRAPALNRVATARLVQPTPAVAVKVSTAAAQAATNHAAIGPSAVRARQQPKACRMTMTRNRPSILKMISSPARTRIWARKAASTPLATSRAAAQAVNLTRP
jgi:hypothetical protein